MQTIQSTMEFIQVSTLVELLPAESQQTVENLLCIIAESIQSIHEYLKAKKLGNQSELGYSGLF